MILDEDRRVPALGDDGDERLPPAPLRVPEDRRLDAEELFQHGPVQADLLRVVPIVAGIGHVLRVRAAEQLELPLGQPGEAGISRFMPRGILAVGINEEVADIANPRS